MNMIIRLTGYSDETPNQLSSTEFTRLIGPAEENQIASWLGKNGFFQTGERVFERKRKNQLNVSINVTDGGGWFFARKLSNVTAEVLIIDGLDKAEVEIKE